MDSSSSSDEQPTAAGVARAAVQHQAQAARDADPANISEIQEATIHDIVTEQLQQLGLAGLISGRSIRPRHDIRAMGQLGVSQMTGDADAANISAKLTQEATIHDVVTEQLEQLGLAGLISGRSTRPRHELAVRQLGLPQMTGLSVIQSPTRPSKISDLLTEQLSNNVSVSRKQIDRLQEELSKEKEKRRAFEKTLKKEQEKTSKLESENQSLRQEVKRQRELIDFQDRKIADLERRLNALHEGNTELRNDNSELRNDNSELRTDNEKLRQDLEEDKRKNNERFAALENMIRNLDIRVPNSQIQISG